MYTTQEIMLQLKVDAKAEEISIDKGMSVLKPACVEWMMQSWKMLREKGKMIRKGWTSIGLDKTFDLSAIKPYSASIRTYS